MALAFFFSCSEKEDGAYIMVDRDRAPQHVSVAPEKNEFVFSEWFSQVSMIPLSGGVVSMIQDVSIMDDDRILLWARVHNDDTPSSVLTVFTKEGKYLDSIVKIGRGPGELPNIADVHVNRFSGTIDVLDNTGTVINQYDLHDWAMSRQIHIKDADIVSAAAFIPVDAYHFLLFKHLGFTRKVEYKIYFYNSESDKSEAQYLPLDKEIVEKMAFLFNNTFFENEGKIYFHDGVAPVVYQFEKNEVQPAIGMNYGRYELERSLVETSSSELRKMMEQFDEKRIIYAHGGFIPAGSLLFSHFLFAGERFMAVIDPERGTEKTFDSIYDDMCSNRRASITSRDIRLVGSKDDILIFCFESGEENPELYLGRLKNVSW